uniref:PRELI/MSF1 domain-containing protein n=1 Tax=Cryptomonas curvata TaxID=233186 RepID=A0A7S0QKG9_9CRYP|mmetsp:Transcript_31510/g.65928  ORF Transcript_31510/g.65928 Transcript_31510/m.65928 type:complete len:208 (+) Transcript_31510:50-673(+)
MPTIQNRSGTYLHPLPVVSAALWDKYENHEWIKDVDVLDRHIDHLGRLRSTRLLTMRGNTPFMFRPFFGNSNPIYLLEEVTIDLSKKIMEVRTSNVNFLGVLLSNSKSRYTPCSLVPGHTTYDISVQTTAFPSSANVGEEAASRFGSISRKLEEFIGRSLLGNIKDGENVLNRWIERTRTECRTGASTVWLCSSLCRESDQPTPPPS